MISLYWRSLSVAVRRNAMWNLYAIEAVSVVLKVWKRGRKKKVTTSLGVKRKNGFKTFGRKETSSKVVFEWKTSAVRMNLSRDGKTMTITPTKTWSPRVQRRANLKNGSRAKPSESPPAELFAFISRIVWRPQGFLDPKRPSVKFHQISSVLLRELCDAFSKDKFNLLLAKHVFLKTKKMEISFFKRFFAIRF